MQILSKTPETFQDREDWREHCLQFSQNQDPQEEHDHRQHTASKQQSKSPDRHRSRSRQRRRRARAANDSAPSSSAAHSAAAPDVSLLTPFGNAALPLAIRNKTVKIKVSDLQGFETILSRAVDSQNRCIEALRFNAKQFEDERNVFIETKEAIREMIMEAAYAP